MKFFIGSLLLVAQALFYGALAYVVISEALDRREISTLRAACLVDVQKEDPMMSRELAVHMCRSAVR